MKQKFPDLDGFHYNIDIPGLHRMAACFPETEEDGRNRVRENVKQQ